MGILEYLGLGGKKSSSQSTAIDTMQTTQVGEDPMVLGAGFRYNIPVLKDFIKDNPNSIFGHYMIGELYLDNGDLGRARKSYITARELEKQIGEESLEKGEQKLKKKAKFKLEKEFKK